MFAARLKGRTPMFLRPGRSAAKGFTTVQILEFVLQVLLGITSLLLTLLILLHKGRGGGLSDMFGGGLTSALGSSGLAERNLNRFTIVLALVWFVAIVALGLITKFQGI
jgi:preprotein translocase subunit SecG